jgi:hypothetical protein
MSGSHIRRIQATFRVAVRADEAQLAEIARSTWPPLHAVQERGRSIVES